MVEIRTPNDRERKILDRVFQGTLPGYWRILITDLLGANGRPFTTTDPSTILRDLTRIPVFGVAVYFVNVGPTGFAGMERTTALQRLLVHELTHVWQGYNGLIASGFMANSLLHQGLCEVRGCSAYSYTPGEPWSSYNAEQQAEIVEHWFARGEQTTDTLYHYIQDNIRSV